MPLIEKKRIGSFLLNSFFDWAFHCCYPLRNEAPMNKALLISPLLFIACTSSAETTSTIDVSSATTEETTSTPLSIESKPSTKKESTVAAKNAIADRNAISKAEKPVEALPIQENEPVVNVKVKVKEDSSKEEVDVSTKAPKKLKKPQTKKKVSQQKTAENNKAKKEEVREETKKETVAVETKKESVAVELSPLQQHLKNIEAQYTDVQSLEANFVQVVTRAEFPEGVEQSGTLSVLQPSYFRWDIEFPMEQSYYFNGDTLKVWNPMNNQLLVSYNQSDKKDVTSILNDLPNLSKLYDVHLVSESSSVKERKIKTIKIWRYIPQ